MVHSLVSEFLVSLTWFGNTVGWKFALCKGRLGAPTLGNNTASGTCVGEQWKLTPRIVCTELPLGSVGGRIRVAGDELFTCKVGEISKSQDWYLTIQKELGGRA